MRIKIPTYLRNKYLVITFLFFVWMLLADQNNLIYQYKLSSDLKEARQEKQYYLDQIEHDRKMIDQLMSDTSRLIKFAREKYLMKRDNEEIFLIIEDEE